MTPTPKHEATDAMGMESQRDEVDASTPEAGNAAEAIGGSTNPLSGKSGELKAKSYQAGNALRHGHARHGSESPTWISWQSMLSRCRYESRDVDAKYAGRGISFAPRWENFEAFLEDVGERPEGTTLDRINNDGNYEPSNCRWATPVEQARNRRNARLTFDQAVEVAVARLSGESAKSIAARYGTSESLPREIAAGRSWKDALVKAKEIIRDR